MKENKTETPRQRIMGDKMVHDLLYSINGGPGEIKLAALVHARAERDVLDMNGVADAKQLLAEVETELSFDVANEVDENGKKCWTNNDMRKLALANKKAKEPRWTETQQLLRDLEGKILDAKMIASQKKIELSYAQDRFKAQLSLCGLVAALCHDKDLSNQLKLINEHKASTRAYLNSLENSNDEK